MTMPFSMSVLTIALVLAVEPGLPDPDLFRYISTQGGFVGLVLLVLWRYRQDFKVLLERKADELAIITRLVEDNTASSTALRVAVATLQTTLDAMNTEQRARYERELLGRRGYDKVDQKGT